MILLVIGMSYVIDTENELGLARWLRQDGSASKAFAAKPDSLSLIPGTHMEEGDNEIL